MACFLLLTVIMLGVAVRFHLSCAQDVVNAVRGRHFLVAFMDHIPGYENMTAERHLYLQISNPGVASVEGEVGFYNYSAAPISFQLPPGNTTKVSLEADLMLQEATKHRKSVYVTSDGDIQVQAFQETVSGRTSYGGTAVLPVTSLSTDYLAATHCVRRRCELVVVSAQDGNSVKLTFRVGLNPDQLPGKARYNNSFFTDDMELEESLDLGESAQVTCFRCDLTGTLITSTKPVAVFSGGDFTKVTGVLKRDMVLEQVIPSKAIGQHYILGSNYFPATGEQVKVVPLLNGTRFAYGSICYVSTRPRQVFDFRRPSDEILEIIGDGQILVAQLIRANNYSLTPDTVMNLPVPVFQWAKAYRVYVPGPVSVHPSDTVHLCLLVPVDTVSVLPSSVTVISRQDTDHGDFKFLTLGLGAEYLLEVTACSLTSCAPFTGFVLKSKFSRTYSVTLRDTIPNFELNATYANKIDEVCSSHVTTTVEADTTVLTTHSEVTTAVSSPGVILTTLSDVTTESSPNASLLTTHSDVTTDSSPNTSLLTTHSDVTTESSPNTSLLTTHSDVTTESSPNTSQLTTQSDVTTESSSSASQLTTPSDVTTESSPSTSLLTTHSDGTTESSSSASQLTTPSDVTTESSPSTSLLTTHGDVTAAESSPVTTAATTDDVTTSPAQTSQTESATTAQQEPTSTASTSTSTTTTTTTTTTRTTTTTTTTTTLPPSRPPAPPSILCPCRCDLSLISGAAAGPKAALSPAEKRELAIKASQAIHAELATGRETLSSFLRAKISSKDSRASSTLVGVAGVSFFAVIFSAVVFSDVVGLVVHVTGYRHHRRRAGEVEAKEEIRQGREAGEDTIDGEGKASEGEEMGTALTMLAREKRSL